MSLLRLGDVLLIEEYLVPWTPNGSPSTLVLVMGPKHDADQIHVVWLDLDLPVETVNNLSLILSDEEKTRADRYSSLLLNHRAVVRLARRRQVVANFCSVSAQDVRFESDSHGRPMIVSSRGENIMVSTSHCGGAGLIAVSDERRIGVDVEAMSELQVSPRFAELVASTNDSSTLSTLTTQQKGDAYLRLWTRKEAYLKATGEGIGRGMNHFDVPLSAEPWGLQFQPFRDKHGWLLYELWCPLPGLKAALVTSSTIEDSTPSVHMSFR